MTDEQRIGHWVQVWSGGRFWPLDPRAEELDIEDIAQGLSHLCRFGGQCKRFYSVAQHSVLVSEICEGATAGNDAERRRLNAFAGLLHDAPEAYICDIPRPVKKHLPKFQEIEARIWDAVCRKWGLVNADTGAWLYEEKLLAFADDTALVTEKRDLMRHERRWLLDDRVDALPRQVSPLPPESARELFLERFRALIAPSR